MDEWAAWFAERRHGGDAAQLRRTLEFLAPIRDTVIHHADLDRGQAVLDVGCGDGLIAFAAAERVGADGLVIFSDISDDLLSQCRQHAAKLHICDRCRFVQASASDLSAIPDAEVDAVTLRSVLIYEPEKAVAFAEFRRVLRPGGRLSLFEPINRFSYPDRPGHLKGYDVRPETDLAARVTALYEAIQPPTTDPMLNFDQGDLLDAAERAGFEQIHLDLQVRIERPPPMRWEAFLHASGNPRIPTIAEAMDQTLSPAERDRLSGALRRPIEQGIGRRRSALAYLWAVRPSK